MSVAINALIDLQSVKDELGISDSASDALLTARINRVSALIEQVCLRIFRLLENNEYIGIPSSRPARIYVKQTPVFGIQLITENSDQALAAVLDPTGYILEKATAGAIFRVTRFRGTMLRRPDITQDFDPLTAQENLLVQYLAGYVTLTQALAAAAWPGATKTVNYGTLLRVGTSPNEQLWLATTPIPTTPTALLTGVTGGTQPTWPATPTPAYIAQEGAMLGTTQVDGTVTWIYLGIVGAVGLGNEGTACTLPDDLKAAALDTVVMQWRQRKQDTSIQSESISGIASVTYGKRGLFPPAAESIVSRYRRIVVR